MSNKHRCPRCEEMRQSIEALLRQNERLQDEINTYAEWIKTDTEVIGRLQCRTDAANHYLPQSPCEQHHEAESPDR